MRKVYIGIGITALALLLLTAAFAFSLTLQNLRLNALSFAEPAAAAIVAAPMTWSDESEITATSSDGVRLEEFAKPEHVCSKDEMQDSGTDFLN